jgi:hypothetical protein
MPSVLPHGYYSSTRVTEAEGLQVQGELRLHSMFQASLGFSVRPHVSTNKQNILIIMYLRMCVLLGIEFRVLYC